VRPGPVIAIDVHGVGVLETVTGRPTATVVIHVAVGLDRIARIATIDVDPIHTAGRCGSGIDDRTTRTSSILPNKSRSVPSAFLTAGVILPVQFPIIASFLADVNKTITADWKDTAGDAVIGVVVVTVIAGFKTRLTFIEILSNHTITADSLRTDIGAFVFSVLIAVVTFFVVLPNDGVAATSF
jgi:hypothetical protein